MSSYRADNCDAYLPLGVGVPPESAPTFFWFRLDGKYHVLSLYRSSGNNGLDQAALACARTMYNGRERLTQGGVPIEVTWVGAVSWNYPWHHHIIPEPSGKAHLCDRNGFLRFGVGQQPMGGYALVSFRVAVDGSVKDAALKRSTGNSYLDHFAVNCVSGWRYLPAFHSGVPTEIDFGANVFVRGY